MPFFISTNCNDKRLICHVSTPHYYYPNNYTYLCFETKTVLEKENNRIIGTGICLAAFVVELSGDQGERNERDS
jgi:hypothetical protein